MRYLLAVIIIFFSFSLKAEELKLVCSMQGASIDNWKNKKNNQDIQIDKDSYELVVELKKDGMYITYEKERIKELNRNSIKKYSYVTTNNKSDKPFTEGDFLILAQQLDSVDVINYTLIGNTKDNWFVLSYLKTGFLLSNNINSFARQGICKKT